MVKVENIGTGSGVTTLTVATADAMVTDGLRGELAQQIASFG